MGMTEIAIWSMYLILFIGALLSPVCGVLGYLVVYLTYNPDIWWAQGLAKLSRPSMFAMALLAFGCILRFKELNWTITKREIQFYAFLVVAWSVSLLSGIHGNENTWEYLEKLSKMFVFIFLFIRIIHSISSYKIVVGGLISGGLIFVYQAHTIGGFYGGRLNNLGGVDFNEANSFASFLAAMIVFLGFEVLRSPLWKKSLFVLLIALMLNAIIMTQSRAVFMGMVLSAPIAFVLVSGRKRFAILASLLMGAFLFVILSDSLFLQRMGTIREEIRAEQFQPNIEPSRWDFWNSAARMFSDHPFGIGVKNFGHLVPYYDPRNPGMDVHNTYLLCLTEIGILGMLLFVLIIASAFLQLKRVRKIGKLINDKHALENHAISLTLVLTVYLLGIMITHSILYSEILWVFLSLPICLENAGLKLLKDRAAAEESEAGGITEDIDGETLAPKLQPRLGYSGDSIS